MADLTDFQRDAVELISKDEGIPTAVLRYDYEDGPEMLLQNGWADEDDFAPQFDLLAAYVAHLAVQSGKPTTEIYDEVQERIESWNEENVGVAAERRTGDE
ncbi:MAG: hypothetical protein ABEH83_05760 [Halobacterium sp.]